MFPKELPKWESAYYYYRKWASLEEFDLLLEHLGGGVRLTRNQSMEPSVEIIDSQSVKWENNRSLTGTGKQKGSNVMWLSIKMGFLLP